MSTKLNPFVGPRSLKYRESLYGRDRELSQLRDLLISEQIVLLYSPSGAGKSSLIEAGLRPILEAAGFKVLPVARVNAAPPGANMEKPLNRYVYSTLAGLESESPEQPLAQDIGRLSLPDYVERLSRSDADYVLVLDQFEEIFTVDPTDRRQKEEYFEQLGAVLHEKKYKLWVLIAMREEYLAALDPFCHSIPGYFNVRFRLELLSADAARRAIKQPAAKAGIPFSHEAVDSLVDDFRKILVQGDDGALVERAGEYVEPLHLQVVCRRLWQRLPDDRTEISPDDVRTQGNVDEALAGYYEECLDTVSHKIQVDERTIRNWFGEKLITTQEIRGQILRGADRSEGMDNRVLDQLVDDHLIRAERRRGLTWYELAHDRLIEPVRQNNRHWRETHLQPWQRTAEDWLKAGRPSTRLLSDSALVSAHARAAENPLTLAPVDREFLEASAREQSARRAQVRLKLLSATLALAIILGAAASYSYGTWIRTRPWAFLVNLSDGQVHRLSSDSIIVGRATERFKPAVSLRPNLISRTHLFIDRSLKALDVRTMNGTTVNGNFLQYGDVRELTEGDVVVLASIAPFKFSPIHYSWWQLWEPRPEAQAIPDTSWGLVIDGASKAVHYLVKDMYYVGLNGQDQTIITEAKTAQSRVILRRRNAGSFAIENLDYEHDLVAMMRLGETYGHGACLIPPAVPLVAISFKMLDEAGVCKHINWRGDYDERMRWEQPVENVIFYLSEKSSFRIVPRIVGLAQAD